MINAEFDTTMGYSKYDKTTEKNNYRNGSTKKTPKSEFGEFEFETPRDRNAEFEPKIVPKNKRDLYGIEVSATVVSNITDQIIPDIKEWQGRPLDDVYPIVFIDAVHFSVREDSRVVKKVDYIVLGIKEAINVAFPNTIQQRCIVHMIRNSAKFVSHKDLRVFCNDLKSIYNSKNEEKGYEELQKVKEKWKDKYFSAFKTWKDNWDAICPFFQFSEPIRKIMYTTNTIESLNRQFRKYTKTKLIFPADMSLLKCLYLSAKNIQKKWTQPYRNWSPILSELSIMFDGRI